MPRGTFHRCNSDGFFDLITRLERADLRQKVGIWRRIELDAPLPASPRQITRRNKKGGEKKERQKGEGKREGLDKNRRERNKEWEINRGRREDARVYFIIGKRWKWKGIGLWSGKWRIVEKMERKKS